MMLKVITFDSKLKTYEHDCIEKFSKQYKFK